MATIAGSQFSVTAALSVNVVETTTGTGLPTPNGSDFNLEVFVGALANAPAIAAGYQGLAVLSPNGLELDLVSGAYAVTDNGTSGNDTLSAFGTGETITGSAFSGTTLNLFGNSDTAVGGAGPDTINVYANLDSVSGGTGNDTIAVGGGGDTVTAGSGQNVINISGSGDSVTGGSTADTINAFSSSDTVVGGSGAEVINVGGSSDLITFGNGNDTVNVGGGGDGDTVTAGASTGTNQDVVNLFGANTTFVDGANKFADTIVGFDQAAGDTIQLNATDLAGLSASLASSQLVSGGTLITLADGSTLFLAGVTSVSSHFFS